MPISPVLRVRCGMSKVTSWSAGSLIGHALKIFECFGSVNSSGALVTSQPCSANRSAITCATRPVCWLNV